MATLAVGGFSNSRNSRNINYGMFTHESKSVIICNFNCNFHCRAEIEALYLKVLGSHVQCKSRHISETVQDQDVITTDQRCTAHQIAPFLIILSDLQSPSPIAHLFKMQFFVYSRTAVDKISIGKLKSCPLLYGCIRTSCGPAARAEPALINVSSLHCHWLVLTRRPIDILLLKPQVSVTLMWLPNQQCQSTEGSNGPKDQSSISIPPRPPHHVTIVYMHAIYSQTQNNTHRTRMWANAQPDGRPAEHRWRPLFNAAKFGWRPLLDAVQ